MKTGLESPVLCAYMLCTKGLNSALLHTLEKPAVSIGRACLVQLAGLWQLLCAKSQQEQMLKSRSFPGRLVAAVLMCCALACAL